MNDLEVLWLDESQRPTYGKIDFLKSDKDDPEMNAKAYVLAASVADENMVVAMQNRI